MTSKYNYIEIARYIFELIDSTSEGDDMLPILKLVQSMREFLDDNLDGVGVDLVEWAGLKHNSSDIAEGYGEKIIQAYPELKR